MNNLICGSPASCILLYITLPNVAGCTTGYSIYIIVCVYCKLCTNLIQSRCCDCRPSRRTSNLHYYLSTITACIYTICGVYYYISRRLICRGCCRYPRTAGICSKGGETRVRSICKYNSWFIIRIHNNVYVRGITVRVI